MNNVTGREMNYLDQDVSGHRAECEDAKRRDESHCIQAKHLQRHDETLLHKKKAFERLTQGMCLKPMVFRHERRALQTARDQFDIECDGGGGSEALTRTRASRR